LNESKHVEIDDKITAIQEKKSPIFRTEGFCYKCSSANRPVIMTHTGVGSGAFNTLFGKLLKIFAILL